MKHVLSGRIFFILFPAKNEKGECLEARSIWCVATNAYTSHSHAFNVVRFRSITHLPSLALLSASHMTPVQRERNRNNLRSSLFSFFPLLFCDAQYKWQHFSHKNSFDFFLPSFECRVTSLNVVNFFYSFPFECAAWIGCFLLHPMQQATPLNLDPGRKEGGGCGKYGARIEPRHRRSRSQGLPLSSPCIIWRRRRRLLVCRFFILFFYIFR